MNKQHIPTKERIWTPFLFLIKPETLLTLSMPLILDENRAYVALKNVESAL